MKMRSIALALALAGSVPAIAAAVETGLPVPIQTYEGISYYSAGVGIEERASLPQRFPLKVVFATDKRNLLATRP